MFIDYVTLMLVNVTAGFFVLAGFLVRKEDAPVQSWAPVFALVGLVALTTGFWMTFTWPLPGSYNTAFGENSVYFGGLMAAAAWHLAKGWDLKPVAIYGAFAGLVALVTGAQFLRLGLSQTPLLTGVGFILAGVAGLGAYPAVRFNSRKLRVTGAGVLILSALIWAFIGYVAFGEHLSHFMKR